ncbi:MAG: response regulator [Thiotrichaceae bacterium]
MTVTNKDSHAILFVDDEEKARKMFTRLVSTQFTVLTAADVKEAKEILDKEHENIGVLITDQRMPGELGVDLLRHIRRTYPKIIRMLTTAYTDLDDAIEAVNTGEIFRYINKPWNVDELLIDLRLAMNFFNIEQDRQQLIQEKMSLSHRQSRIEMMKSLITMSSSQAHFNRPKQAVKSFLQQVAEPQILAEQNFTKEANGYWEGEVDKTEKMIQINTSLNQWSEQASDFINTDGSSEAIDYQGCIDQVGNELSINIMLDGANNPSAQSALNQQGITALLSVISQTLANSGNDLKLAINNVDQGVEITGTASSPNSGLAEQFLTMGDANSDQQLGQLLATFILIHHLGGSVKLGFEETNLATIQVTIPQSMDNDTDDIQDGVWIEDLFVLYS